MPDTDHPLDKLIGLCDPDELADLRERARAFREDVTDRMRPDT